MKCQILFCGKDKKNIINFSSTELAHRMVKVKFKDQYVRCNEMPADSGVLFLTLINLDRCYFNGLI